MIVELMGPPGAGKSTAAARLAIELAELGVSSTSLQGHNLEDPHVARLCRPVRILSRVWRLWSTPGLTIHSIPRWSSKAAAQELLRLQRREAFRRRLKRPLGLVLLDEGPLHKLSMMAAAGHVRNPLGLLARLSEPSLCVGLDIDLETARRRIRGRPESCHLDRSSDEEILKYLSRYLTAYESILGRLRCPVLRVDATSEIARSVAMRIASGGSESCTSDT